MGLRLSNAKLLLRLNIEARGNAAVVADQALI